MRNDWLLEAAALRRQEEQSESPADDNRDPWALKGPPRCANCRELMSDRSMGPLCSACDPAPEPRTCGVSGCERPAGANGRCNRHVHGDDEFWGWGRGCFSRNTDGTQRPRVRRPKWDRGE
jgi:hypothetical protein